MFEYVKQLFVSTMMCFGSLSSVNPLECISMNNQNCKVRPEIVNIDCNELLFYSFRVKTNKCSGSCNNLDEVYANFCVPDVVKNFNIKVFNLLPGANENRHIKWHETCKYKSKCL